METSIWIAQINWPSIGLPKQIEPCVQDATDYIQPKFSGLQLFNDYWILCGVALGWSASFTIIYPCMFQESQNHQESFSYQPINIANMAFFQVSIRRRYLADSLWKYTGVYYPLIFQSAFFAHERSPIVDLWFSMCPKSPKSTLVKSPQQGDICQKPRGNMGSWWGADGELMGELTHVEDNDEKQRQKWLLFEDKKKNILTKQVKTIGNMFILVCIPIIYI